MPSPPSADSDASDASTEPGDDVARAIADELEYDVTRATVDEIMKAMVVTVAEDDDAAEVPPGPAAPTQPDADTVTPKLSTGGDPADVVAPATLGDHTTPYDDDYEPAARSPAVRGKAGGTKTKKDKDDGAPGEAEAPAPTA